MTEHDTDRFDATFLRAGLLLGIVRGEAAIAWADGIIDRDHEVDPNVLELSLTPAEDLSALRHALYPLADKAESSAVVRRLLSVVAADFESGRRNTVDTFRVVHQLRRLVAVPGELKAELTAIEMSHMLATAGVEGHLEVSEARLRAWLAEFVTEP